MRDFQRLWLAVACFFAIFLIFSGLHLGLAKSPLNLFTLRSHATAKDIQSQSPVTLVVASQKLEDTSWIADTLPDWQKLIYVVDDPKAPLTTPYNKGREGSVYLTYIIDNYERLTGTIIFSHATRWQWHNDDLFYDGLTVLSRLQLPYVQSQGYVNLRCVWTLGCPAEIHPLIEAEAPAPASDASSKDARAGSFYKEAFQELFPGETVPETIGAACCAQMAVTADRIKTRPKSDYERYRDWLRDTPLRDDLSGRIMEYSWHIIFGKESVDCPNAQQCYCNVFDICDLHCEEEGACRSVYTLPKYSVLPQGWPDLDWDGNWRDVTEIRAKMEAHRHVLG